MARVVRNRAKKTPGMRGQVRREWKKRTYFFFGAMFMAISLLTYGLFFGDMGVVKYFELRENRKKIEADIVRLERDNKVLGEQVNSLKKDPYYIEKYAREEYGLAKPDEVIFQFKKEEKQE
jgi:cell division protein FtsB